MSNVDSEDEMDWEEVDVPQQAAQRDIEITLQARPGGKQKNKEKSAAYAERLTRITCHKLHTITLLLNAWVRNQWLNDELLHARLLSLTPLPLQNAFAAIHKSRVPDPLHRGRLFENAVVRLVEWWSQTYFEVEQYGHLKSITFEEVQATLSMSGEKDASSSTVAKAQVDDASSSSSEEYSNTESEDDEPIRSAKSLMKHALMRSGSRDVSAQLFTALCRSLGIPARLVVSLQSVPWQAGIGKDKKKYSRKPKDAKGKGKATDEDDEDGDMEEVVIPKAAIDTKGKGKAKPDPVIRLRKTKSKPKPTLPKVPRRVRRPNPLVTPPVFWTEVFSRPDARWLPVDPIRALVNKRKVFDPSPTTSTTPDRLAAIFKVENRMIYVVGIEEDGYGRDVTARYARNYGAKQAKAQGAGESRSAKQEFYHQLLTPFTRPYSLTRDTLEDNELNSYLHTEPMPTTLGGFKDHPLYVLERHLRQDEVIWPAPGEGGTKEVGQWKGEPVYPRGSVRKVRSAEGWMRAEGRLIREGQNAAKLVKRRAGTVRGQREVEILKVGMEDSGLAHGEDVMQALYVKSQTEVYKPPPIVDGIIPKNDFGNIDLYMPSMLPPGGVHIPYKGVAKVARKLGFDYAEAVTGFEFKKRRAFPLLEGAVVASENEGALLEAYWEVERDAAEKAEAKKRQKVLKQWTRLVQGLRIRKRLVEQYAHRGGGAPDHIKVEGASGDDENVPHGAAGFLTGVDAVVQPFHLPRYQHQQILPSLLGPSATSSLHHSPASSGGGSLADTSDEGADAHAFASMALSHSEMEMDEESDLEMEPVAVIVQPVGVGTPKTMQEMAEDAERKSKLAQKSEGNSQLSSSNLSRAAGKAAANSTTSSSKPNLRARPRRVPRKRGRSEDEDDDERTPEGAPSSLSSSPPKKTRSRRTVSTPTVASEPTRVLRTRISKTRAQLEEERRAEAAYRIAVAE